jgi:hypothetical protein
MNVSLAVLTSAALLTSLHQLTGVAQPVVGIPIHNRANATQKQTLGLFAGLTPLTHCFVPGQNLAAVVAQLKATQRADFRHAGLSRADFVKAWPMVAQGSEPFPLTFSFEPQNYDVDFEGLQFNITAFTPSVISRPAQLYLREYREGQPALLECLQHPGCDSSACSAQLIETMIALLDAQAQPQAAATVPRGPTAEMGGLFQRFEAQVRQRPDACALTDANGLSLSYRELHAQALQAACAGAASRIALTFGGDGAYLLVDGNSAALPAPRVAVVDTVGAGDTFWGNCVADWVLGHSASTEAALRSAMQAAAINCTRTGCQPPRWSEVQAFTA